MGTWSSLRCVNLLCTFDIAQGFDDKIGYGTGESAVNRRFAFETGSDCLPMSVKRKLDRIAIKIGRRQWLGMSPEEQTSISSLPCESKEECETLRSFIYSVLASHGTQPSSLTEVVAQLADPPVEVPAAVIESAKEVGFLIDQAKWLQLDDHQRYALTKLIDPGKKSKRARALAEFLDH
jgi:hypothetical protein